MFWVAATGMGIGKQGLFLMEVIELISLSFFCFLGYSLKLTAILPLKIGKIPKGIKSSNYPFLGAMLVSSHKSKVNPINP